MKIVKVPCLISLKTLLNRFPKYVDEYETLLTDNRIWKQRLVGIGVVSPERAMAMGVFWSNAAWFWCRIGFA